MGKTAFAMNIAENAAVLDGKVVGVFSLEMSKEALLMRMLASHAQVDSKDLRQGFLTKDDMRKLTRAVEELMQSKLFIDDTPGISVSEMRAKARRLKQTGRARPGDRGLPAAHVGGAGGRQAVREPHSGSFGDLARPEGAGQGTARAGGGAFAVKPRAREPRRRSSSAA